MSQPNPNSTFNQLQADWTIYLDLVKNGVIGVADLGTLAEKLMTLDDPLLKRLGITISKASALYGEAEAKPLGYYACIAIHNTAIDDTWNGGSEADPYGSPNKAA